MPRIYVRRANEYKGNFEFLNDGTNICNSAYHMQFIEHCYKQKQELEKTTKSLMNRSIIVELGSIVELCLYEILSNLEVNLHSQKKKPLNVPEKESLGPLIDLAANYEIINKTMKNKLKKLSEDRNSIHFKRYKKKRILEYNYYTDSMVDQSINIFKEFMDAIHLKVKNTEKTFLWPWD